MPNPKRKYTIEEARAFAKKNPEAYNKALDKINPDPYRGTRKFAELLINQYPDRFKGLKPENFLSMLDSIAKAESPQGNVIQRSYNKKTKKYYNGPARGYYQIETTSAPTFSNRYKAYQDILKPLSAVPLPDIKVPKSGDVRSLSRDEQARLALANMSTVAAVKKEKLNPFDSQNSWLNFHWNGSPADKPARQQHWKETFGYGNGGEIESYVNQYMGDYSKNEQDPGGYDNMRAMLETKHGLSRKQAVEIMGRLQNVMQKAPNQFTGNLKKDNFIYQTPEDVANKNLRGRDARRRIDPKTLMPIKPFGYGQDQFRDGGITNQPTYNDSLQLWKAYQFQKANQLPSQAIKQFNLLPLYPNNKIGKRIDNFTDWFNDIQKNSARNDYKTVDELEKAYPNENNGKVAKYYNSLKFDVKPHNALHTSPDLVHPLIAPTGSYFDGNALSPIYKKPVGNVPAKIQEQPTQQVTPEAQTQINTGSNTPVTLGMSSPDSSTGKRLYRYGNKDITEQEFNKYKTLGKHKIVEYADGGQIEPTRADSLDLLNNTKSLENYYSKYNKSYSSAQDASEVNVHALNKNSADTFFTSGASVKVPRKDGTSMDLKRELFPKDQYYKKIDNNRYYQRELADRILDTRAPMALYDKRIAPNNLTAYLNDIPNDGMNGDGITIYGYNPLSVTPWDMLNSKDKANRISQFGVAGTPYKSVEEFQKANPAPVIQARKNNLEKMPIINKPLSISNNQQINPDSNVTVPKFQPYTASNNPNIAKGYYELGQGKKIETFQDGGRIKWTLI